jgi:branched-subunit amino acid aminotransferase/4-amino-4-deoxychorismate lyase
MQVSCEGSLLTVYSHCFALVVSRLAQHIRPLMLGSSAQLGLNPPQEYNFVVYCIPTGVVLAIMQGDNIH